MDRKKTAHFPFYFLTSIVIEHPKQDELSITYIDYKSAIKTNDDFEIYRLNLTYLLNKNRMLLHYGLSNTKQNCINIQNISIFGNTLISKINI